MLPCRSPVGNGQGGPTSVRHDDQDTRSQHPVASSTSDTTGRDAKHAGVPLHRVRTGEVRCEEFLYELKAGPAGGRLRRPSSRRQPHDGHRGTGSPCRIVLSPWRCGRPRRSDCDEVWAASNLRVVSAPTSSVDSYPCALHVSRKVVGGRRPRPRAACGGPAGYWRRGRQHAGGGPGLQPLVRQGAGRAMPRAGRSPGRACRPGGSGSNHPVWR